MKDFTKHLIRQDATIRQALEQINRLAQNLTLFVCDEEDRLVGTLTDGDIRRNLINGVSLTDPVSLAMFRNFRFLRRGNYDLAVIDEFRRKLITLIPVLDDDSRIVQIVNLAKQKSFLPLEAIIMAGGKGERLRPLTEHTPKPLLKVGNKPILEHNIDRIAAYGIDSFYLTIRYLGSQIVDYFGDGSAKNVRIQYLEETNPLGTIGSLALLDDLQQPNLLVMNSDLLTNIDLEDFYRDYLAKDADMAVATIPYQVTIPYAILETDNENILSLKEKPTYTYYANAGIYLLKKSAVELIPRNQPYDAPDLIEEMIRLGKKVVYYPLIGYWLDIGKPEDYKKAQEDIRHIQL